MDDLVAFMEDRNLPLDEIGRMALAERVLSGPPEQGYMLLAIPHYIVLAVLGAAAVVCVVIAWFAILFTGRYPRGLFDFVLGVNRWGLRVGAYMWLLITDRYPPFSLR